MDRHQMFAELTGAFGPSGYEGDVRKIMSGYLSQRMEISTDRIGSVVGYHEGKKDGPKILVAAHMDEVGFMVKKVTKQGYLRFLPIGGWWPQVLLSQRVKLRTRKGDFEGIIGSKPPHVMKEDERKKPPKIDDLFIDLGVVGENALDGIDPRPGDPMVPVSEFKPLANGVLAAKAWDDRVGCAVLAETAADLGSHPNQLYLAGTVQEEVGLRGARTVAGLVEPDVAFAVDVALAHDVPSADNDSVEKFGAGASVLVYDSTMIPNLGLRDLVCETAEAEGIPYHLTSIRGGYDTGVIHISRIGVPSIALGLPSRYIHSHVSVIYEEDYAALLNLVKALVKRLDGKKLAKILKFT